jgi:hypothetical protein
MPHPSLGLPPRDATAGLPAAAARLRASRARVAQLALENTVRAAPHFNTTYNELMLRRLLRDYERHIEQLARALETGDAYFVTQYAEWLVPVYRRREMPMRDVMALLAGLRDAAATVLTPAEQDVAETYYADWRRRLARHGRLAGDHQGNKVVRFFWKGAGIADDKWI